MIKKTSTACMSLQLIGVWICPLYRTGQVNNGQVKTVAGQVKAATGVKILRVVKNGAVFEMMISHTKREFLQCEKTHIKTKLNKETEKKCDTQM